MTVKSQDTFYWSHAISILGTDFGGKIELNYSGQLLLNTTDHFSQKNTTRVFFTTTATRWRYPACLWESSWLSSLRSALKEKKAFVKYVSNLFDGVLLMVSSKKLMWWDTLTMADILELLWRIGRKFALRNHYMMTNSLQLSFSQWSNRFFMNMTINNIIIATSLLRVDNLGSNKRYVATFDSL